ncbi:MAG: hypothetical protein ABIY47_13330 [Opitutaceae bacterium]
MSSAAPPPFSPLRTVPPLLRELRAVYRRVCILRASGKDEEAEELLAGKVAALLSRAQESPEISEIQIETLLTQEEERVENAHALAEILLPLLTASSVTAKNPRVVPGLPHAVSCEEFPSASAPAIPFEPSSENSNGSAAMLPGIADFIDEMLTQERAPANSRPARRDL